MSTAFGRNGNRMEVTIADDGPGMDAEKVERAMRGGFTSKATGTGLGLGICRHLVTAHGGTFDLKSEPGEGVTVRLSFPAATQS